MNIHSFHRCEKVNAIILNLISAWMQITVTKHLHKFVQSFACLCWRTRSSLKIYILTLTNYRSSSVNSFFTAPLLTIGFNSELQLGHSTTLLSFRFSHWNEALSPKHQPKLMLEMPAVVLGSFETSRIRSYRVLEKKVNHFWEYSSLLYL